MGVKATSDQWDFRCKLTNRARTKVKKVQAEQMLKENEMTLEQTMEFIIDNFQIKK